MKNNINDFYTSPPNYKSYIKKLCELKGKYPFLEVEAIGQSVLAREIYSVGIGNMNNVTLFAGAFHAQEWLTCSLLVKYLETLAISVKEKTTIHEYNIAKSLEKRGIIIVPMVNPDGVSIALEGVSSAGHLKNFVDSIMENFDKSWQANARGVDLNHNYDAGFDILKELERSAGITSESPRQYGGEYPHSEPETRAMLSILKNKNVETAYAFHSQGEEIFYEYGENTPSKGVYIAEILSKVSGYKLVKNDGLYSHGGFKDYFIDKYKRPGFTIEIGKGQNPLPITDLDDIYDKILKLLLVATIT